MLAAFMIAPRKASPMGVHWSQRFRVSARAFCHGRDKDTRIILVAVNSSSREGSNLSNTRPSQTMATAASINSPMAATRAAIG
jgi:hypothetical protein